MSIIDIFFAFVKIGALSFGGAYAAMPLIEQQIVKIKGWLTIKEFNDLIAIDELTPGPILINSATFIGMKLGGIKGAIAASIGCIVPACIVSLCLIYLYKRYKDIPVINEIILMLKCMSIATIASTIINMLIQAIMPSGNINIPVTIMTGISLLLIKKSDLNPIYLILGSGFLNLLINTCFR